MTRPALLLPAALCLGLLGPPAAGRDDRAAEVKKEKAAVEANLAKAGLGKVAKAETDDLLVYAAVPDTRVKPLADAAQKAFQLARTALKFEPGEKLWPGKLSVIVLTDPQQFTTYVRMVEQRRPEKGVFYSADLRGDVPTVVDSVEAGERATDAEIRTDAAATVAAAVLAKKAGTGTPLPEWLQLGFGRSIAARAEGGAKLSAYRAKVKAAVLGTKTQPVVVRPADVWSGQKSKDSDLVAASLAEYLVFGPDADKFPKLLSALKPSDTNAAPTVASALTDLEWSPEALEVGWKQWLLKLK